MWILYFSSFTSECIFRSESRLAVTALSQKSLCMQWPSFFGVRELERDAVEASARWDRCHTLLHSIELWRGVSTVTVQRRWGLSPMPAQRSAAVPMASSGTKPHGAVCPSGRLAEGFEGFAAAKVDDLMWFRGSAQACWGSQWWDFKKMIHEYWASSA